MAELENCLKLSDEILTWTFCKILWQQEIDSDQYVKNFRIKRLNSFIELKKYDDAVDTIIMALSSNIKGSGIGNLSCVVFMIEDNDNNK